jgi:hypothetical protein
MRLWDFKNTSLVLLGAGFSYAATKGNTPLMRGFFDQLSPSEHRELCDFIMEVGCGQRCPTIRDANIERVLLSLEQARSADDYVLEGWFDRWRDKLDLLRRQVGEYTLERLAVDLEAEKESWVENTLGSTGFSTTFVSMNYDCVAESILVDRVGTKHCHNATCPHCKMRQLLQYSCSCGVQNRDLGERWKGSLIKLHGSIAWWRCTSAQCCASECIDSACDCEPYKSRACPSCRQTCSPVMVFPTMSKNLRDIPQIGTMWQAARCAFESAESILFFGFSLPESDELLGQMMRSCCRERRVLKKVGVIDCTPSTVIERFRQVVDPSWDVEYVHLDVVPNTVPSWYEAPALPVLKSSMNTSAA